MKNAILGALALSLFGCDAVLTPVAMVAAPVAMAVEQTRIRQPVSVVAQNGNVLAGPQDAAQTGGRKFQTGPDTVYCQASHGNKSINGTILGSAGGGELFAMTCNKGYSAVARFDRPMSAAVFKFGLVPKGFASRIDKAADVDFLLVCASEFRGGAGAVAPFEMSCGRDRTMFQDGEFSSSANVTGVAAVSTAAIGPDRNRTQIWINF